MRIVTPAEVAGQTQNKYLGVLVAAKFARYVNDFPRDRSVDWEEKLTTRAFDELVRGRLKYRLVLRKRQQDCPQCDAERKRERRQAKRQEVSA